MSIFINGLNESLTITQVDEIAIMVKIRDSSRIDELPSNYTVLGENQLNFGTSAANGSIDANGYFQAGSLSPGGEAVAILSDDGRIFVSFAGTNDTLDYSSIFSFGDNSYIDGFEKYLESVANYASANGYEIALVTGKSLGGAATNILADSPDIAGGAYVNATFFAVASPAIADTPKVFNFGYDNDFAFESYEKYFGSGDGDHATTTDNIILYNSEYADPDWTQGTDMSAHSYANFELGITGLTSSVFADELTQDSFVIISKNNSVDMQLAYDRTDSNAEDVYLISSQKREDNVSGTDKNDHIDTGDWNDTINSLDGDDVIFSGSGYDIINSGAGNDTIWGGTGNDTIDAGSGDDEIHGDAQSDLIYAGEGNDTVWGGDGIDTIYLENGNDIFNDESQSGKWGTDEVHGGAGNDVFNGVDGNDTYYGDAGNDTINGGKGNNIIEGGSGDDIIDGGEGNDQIDGGSGNDLIYAGSGDIIYGGDDKDTFVLYAKNLTSTGTISIDGGTGSTVINDINDIDTLVLGDGVTIVPGSYSITLDADGNSYSGTMQITDGQEIITVNFSEIEDIDVIICFMRGTTIETEYGNLPIETLKAGDQVRTKDHGVQTIRWIGSSTRRNNNPDLIEKIAPIKISAGALGRQSPKQDLYVSPQHRILVNSQIAKRMFGKQQVLVSAKDLLCLQGIEKVYDFDVVEYFHILLDHHEIVFANGAEAETLFTGPEALKAVTDDARAEILELFPELDARINPMPARFIPQGHKSRKLAKRHQINSVSMQN